MELETPVRTLDSLTDNEIESCFEGSSNVDLVRGLLEQHTAPNGWVWDMDFGDAFATAIEGFIGAEAGTSEWEEAWEINREWGEAIADRVNELLGKKEMTSTYWTVTTKEKKSCEEREIWFKGGETITRITGYRWGVYQIETNDGNPPEGVDLENPNGIDLNNYHSDNVDSVELVELMDGWYSDVEWPEYIPEDVQEDLENIWEEDSYEGWESMGWIQTDTESWFYGPLELVKEKDND